MGLERISTGIKELDELFGGGLIKGSTTLVAGAPGTGKTTLGLQFIIEGLKKEEAAVIVTFEEFPEILYRDALNFGWDLKKYEEKGLLKILFTSPKIFLDELEKQMGLIDEFISKFGEGRMLLDPVTYFHYEVKDKKELRPLYNRLVNGLKRAGFTSIFTCEVSTLFGELLTVGERLPFIADNIVVLKYAEVESRVEKALLILKARGSYHSKDIRRFEITGEGVKVGEKFEGREGILSSSPRLALSEKFVRAMRF